MATFSSAINPGTLALGGPAANNYTLAGASGAVGVAQTNLTVTARSNLKPYDGTITAAAVPIITAGSIQTGDTEPIWTETYDSPAVGSGKTLTPAGVVLDGNGGANYNYTYASDFTGVITALSTSTLLSSAINPSGLTTNVAFTATVTGVPSLNLPTGNVIFSANGTPFATNGLINGSITASTTALPVGHNAITAQYAGDGAFPGSSSSLLDQVVTNSVVYSHTNIVLSLVNNRNGTFTLNLRGTPGGQYYVVTSGNIKTAMTAWTPVVGSTNTAASSDGTWSCLVSNAAPAYYRPVAVNPAP
jgi:hypothetical protein